MELVKLKPEIKNAIWAGKRLIEKYHYRPLEGTDTIAEAWSLSFHKDGLSRYVTKENPKARGEIFANFCDRVDWGKACRQFKEFPVLIKLIDSGDNLSVQVHPSDEYALENEGQYGKTEFWYVIDCDEGAGVYIGFKDEIFKDEYATRIANGTLEEVLQFFPVKVGDNFFIPSGTVHAIGKGVTLVEIQQSSNITYRVYDYGRLGEDGKPRQLHINKALDVSELEPYIKPCFRSNVLAECKYFTTEINNGVVNWFKPASFTAITFVSGIGAISYSDGRGKVTNILAQGSETYFIPAGVRVTVTLLNHFALFTYVSEDAIELSRFYE